MSTLLELFDEYECDKGSLKHRYDRIYQPQFIAIKDEPLNILEIGVFKGASVSVWLKYFPNATIYCIDIFDRVAAEDIEVLRDERVNWINHDTTASSLAEAIRTAWADIKFDIIVDDGAHWHPAIKDTFVNCFPFLSESGSYYIEDVYNMDLPHVAEHIQTDSWLKKQSHRFSVALWNEMMYNITQHTVEHFDLTLSDPYDIIYDTYIIKVTQ